MTRPLKAIETRYGGCRFRSRLEARWAVFFNALDIPWEYEPEGFELPSGWYLPDFRLVLPSGGFLWLEVKPFQDHDVDPRWKDFARNGSCVQLAVTYGMHRPGDDCSRQHGHRRIYLRDGLLRTVTTPGGIVGAGTSSSPSAVNDAYAAAASARFEFGESGTPTPVVPIRNCPYPFSSCTSKKDCTDRSPFACKHRGPR